MEYVSRLLSFIPDQILESCASRTRVNRYVKKLQGELLFKLLFYCLLTEKETSLRGMRSAVESALFQSFSQPSSAVRVIAHSSISERLNTVKPLYFQHLFEHCVKKYRSSLDTPLQEQIVRFDSTIVSLSSKLLVCGYHLKGGDADKYRLLKFTIGYSDIPDCICLYTEQASTSENAALPQAILAHKSSRIHVFDRGITSRPKYDDLAESSICFVSRIDPQAKHVVHKENSLREQIQTSTLTIISDRWVYLFTQYKKRSNHPLRIIQAVRKKDSQPIAFITNIEKLSAEEITEIYKSRWQIELFFKFIKQHLNFSHLLNRTENGIRSVMYVTMTVAILLLHYRKEQQIKGYKEAKRKFAGEFEKDLLYNFATMCGADPQKTKDFLYHNHT